MNSYQVTNNCNDFLNKDILFENSWKGILTSEINEIVFDDVPGKRDFISFFFSIAIGIFRRK